MARNWQNCLKYSLCSYFYIQNFATRLVTIVTNKINESYKHDNPFRFLEIKENLHFNSIVRLPAVDILEKDSL